VIRFVQQVTKWPVELSLDPALPANVNGGECNQTFAAVIANHPFTNAFVEACSQSKLRETMSDQPIAAPTKRNSATSMPAEKT